MKRKFFILTTFGILVAAAGCGKKVDDVGPQFSVKSNGLDAKSISSPDYVIKRDDPKSGPQYEMTSTNSPDIDYVDKRLICGPTVIKAKRTLRSDRDFTHFQISEEEFEGLNLLPAQPQCNLEIVVANKVGSTVTENIPAQLHFDSNPPITVLRHTLSTGCATIYDGAFVLLEQYDIANTLDYPIGFTFKPSTTAEIRGRYIFTPQMNGNLHEQALGTISFPAESQRFALLPANIAHTGNMAEGFKFKVPAKAQVSVLAYSSIPARVLNDAPTQLIIPPRYMGESGTISVGSRRISSLQIDTIRNSTSSLTMWSDVEPKVDDDKQALMLKYNEVGANCPALPTANNLTDN